MSNARPGLVKAALAFVLLLVLPGQSAPPVQEARSILVAARPIARFGPDAAQRRVGALEFRGGLALSSTDSEFGGLSGLWRSADGAKLVAVSDRARWLTASPVYSAGRLSGLADTRIAPVLAAGGGPLSRTRFYDTEGLAIVDGAAFVAIERAHAVMRFDWARHGVKARATPVAMPPDIKDLRSNRGLEGVGVAPKGSPLAGSLVAIAERSEGADGPTMGFVLAGKTRGTFRVVRRGGFDVTDLAFLPGGGDMLILERFYELLRGVAMRIRRIDGDTIKPGAMLDGPVLIEADLSHEIDNMEGMAMHRNAQGETILTIVSDDNFSMLQRTLLLEFALVGE